jgi:hypothetical protein
MIDYMHKEVEKRSRLRATYAKGAFHEDADFLKFSVAEP